MNSKKIMIGVLISLSLTLTAPIWYIGLVAPQYPEPVYIQIYAYKLEGAINTLNILNHYIGMHPLPEQMIEFTLFPVGIVLFVFWGIYVVVKNKKNGYLYWGIALLVATAAAAVDFWAWEYYYGHNLDPKAAIKIPGQVYQPPLLGTKTILNFQATALPHIGFLFLLLSMVGPFVAHKRYKDEKNITTAPDMDGV